MADRAEVGVHPKVLNTVKVLDMRFKSVGLPPGDVEYYGKDGVRYRRPAFGGREDSYWIQTDEDGNSVIHHRRVGSIE